MANELAKLLLEQAGTFLTRKDAIAAAIDLGMPIEEARQYLDWLDAVRDQTGEATPGSDQANDETDASEE